MTAEDDLKKVAEAIGGFIQYWGFRNIHGRIWAVVFLSPKPISTLEIMDRLSVSKGLLSGAINELLEYKLILKVAKKEVHGRYAYVASENIGSIVFETLKTRELLLIEHNYRALTKLSAHSPASLEQIGVSAEKARVLRQLTSENRSLLKDLLRKKIKKISDWIRLSKRARVLLKLRL